VLKRAGGEDRLLGQVLAGKYRIEEKIDEGGMGCVYRATHVLMEKTVAVKVLHPALAADDKIVARFTREAKAASRISHPHAINVTDFGESDNGVVYLVMEYLKGRTLKEVVRSGGPMPLARVVEIVHQVSGALEAAHVEGVVHRDLKSDNIMLEEAAGGGDWAKVLDFGIAKIQQTAQSIHETDPGLTAPNLIIGTPQYMSPEQCSQASDIDARSDVYSFGVIIYELLAGHVPFTADSPTGVMMKHIQEPAPSILDERKDLPASIGRVIARALAKRPEERGRALRSSLCGRDRRGSGDWCCRPRARHGPHRHPDFAERTGAHDRQPRRR
jgi:serine/threonine-protein kinase